jgi:Arc/MetJ family transcription regulator
VAREGDYVRYIVDPGEIYRRYTGMTKRLVDIDDEVLEDARRLLGTATIKETVNTALAESVKAARRQAVTKEDLQRVGTTTLTSMGSPP